MRSVAQTGRTAPEGEAFSGLANCPAPTDRVLAELGNLNHGRVLLTGTPPQPGQEPAFRGGIHLRLPLRNSQKEKGPRVFPIQTVRDIADSSTAESGKQVQLLASSGIFCNVFNSRIHYLRTAVGRKSRRSFA